MMGGMGKIWGMKVIIVSVQEKGVKVPMVAMIDDDDNNNNNSKEEDIIIQIINHVMVRIEGKVEIVIQTHISRMHMNHLWIGKNKLVSPHWKNIHLYLRMVKQMGHHGWNIVF
jgi:hypothetical protein